MLSFHLQCGSASDIRRRKADGRFHYGYYKFDAIFSLFAAMIMVGSGLVISYTGIEEYIHPAMQHTLSFNAVYIALVSIITAVVLANQSRPTQRRADWSRFAQTPTIR